MNDFTIVNLQDLTTATGLTENDFLAIGQGSNALTKATIQQVGALIGVSASVVLGDKDVEPTVPSFAFAESGLYPEWGNVEIIGNLGILIFDGTNFSKTEINFIANGIVEEGNTEAVSGGEVYDKIQPLNEKTTVLNEVVLGYEDLPLNLNINGYVNLSGAFTSSSTYRISDFIPVSEFEKYIGGFSGSENSLIVSAYVSNNQESFISGSPVNKVGASSSIVTDVEFTIPSGVNFIRVLRHTNVSEDDVFLTKISENSLERTVNGYESTPSWENGFINTSGEEASSSSYRITPFIKVKTGQLLDLSLSGSTSVLLVSAYASNVQSSFIPTSEINIIGTSIPSEPKQFSISIPSGVEYIRLSRNNTTPIGDIYIKQVGLNERVQFLEQKESSYDINVFSANKNQIFSRRKPIFSFIFDDLNDTDELTYNIFKEYGFNVGFALQTNKLNAENTALYQKMYMNGATILSHGTSGNLEPSMTQSKTALKQRGFVVSGWVTNNSVLDPLLIPVVKKYYGYAFTSAPPAKGVFPPVTDFNETVDPCELKRVGLEGWNYDEVNQQEIKDLIDYAIDNNLLITFYGHEMPSTYLNTDNSSRFKESDLRGVLSYLKDKQENGLCEVLSPDDAIFQYYKGIIF